MFHSLLTKMEIVSDMGGVNNEDTQESENCPEESTDVETKVAESIRRRFWRDKNK